MNKIKFYINKWIKGIRYKKFCKTHSKQTASCNDCPYYSDERNYCEKLEYTGIDDCYKRKETE